MKRMRNDMGLTNVEIMIPFVRTVDQAKAVVEELAHQAESIGENGLKIIMMCEIPSNALLASSSGIFRQLLNWLKRHDAAGARSGS